MKSHGKLVGLLLLLLTVGTATTVRAQTSVIIGAVEDSSGRAIPDVQVTLIGTPATGLSDAGGRFRVGPLRPATYMLQFRRLGYAPVTAMAELTRGDTLRLSIEMTPSATTLATMNVTATSTSQKLEQVGFVRRRMDGTVPPSRFITRAEFQNRPPLTMTDLLGRMGGVGARCANPTVFVDGAMMADEPPKDSVITIKGKRVPADPFGEGMKRLAPIDVIPPIMVDAVEAYAGPAETPVEFKAAGRGFRCVILVWTRAQ